MTAVIKNILLALLAATLCVSCSQKKSFSPVAEWMSENGKIKVLSTISQIGDLAEAVGGERVDCLVLVPGEMDPHSYELVKGDGEKFVRADLILYNGLGLEHGASLSAILKSSPKALPVGDEIRRITPNEILEKDGVVDPHVWMDVSLWQKAAGRIAEKLQEVDPDGSEYYLARAAQLEKEMESTHNYMRDLLQKIPENRRYLVTSHDAFRYFARSYLAETGEADWSGRFTAPEGLAPDGQLNPVDIRRTIDFLRKHQVRVVFPESNVSRDAVAKIASASRELGFDVRLCKDALYGDSTGGLPYLEMIRSNAEVIFKHLQEQDAARD
jgi:manganese/zinc/iron transport system substrate-binding protein